MEINNLDSNVPIVINGLTLNNHSIYLLKNMQQDPKEHIYCLIESIRKLSADRENQNEVDFLWWFYDLFKSLDISSPE
jgi:hypothetical protein